MIQQVDEPKVVLLLTKKLKILRAIIKIIPEATYKMPLAVVTSDSSLVITKVLIPKEARTKIEGDEIKSTIGAALVSLMISRAPVAKETAVVSVASLVEATKNP